MSRKEQFISEMQKLIDEGLVLSDEAKEYFNALSNAEDKKTAQKFTENGVKILTFMRNNKSLYNNMFKSKDIGEGLGLTSRVVAGGMRKLVTDGYVEKVGENPIIYMLSSLGETEELTC